MQTDRRAILTLVALGRVTPAEAERLLLACNAGRENLWVPVACLAAGLTLIDVHPLTSGATQAIHQLQPLLNHLFGGIL